MPARPPGLLTPMLRRPVRGIHATAATRMANPVISGCFNAKTGNYFYETSQPTTLRLPGGGTIASVGANSTESNLFRFLSDPQVPVDTVDLTRG